MRIVSWNINGIRAVHRKGNWKDVLALKPDILCLQEVKADVEQIPADVRDMRGYSLFLNASQAKKGYSGVAILSNREPESVEYGIGDPQFDQEGRVVTAFFKDFILSNIYFPNGGMGPERLAFKLDFYDAFLEYAQQLRAKNPNVLFCGDVNVAHEEIDLARPKENQSTTGFLPEERAWVDEVLAAGFVDVFRHFNPNVRDAYTYWDLMTRARDRNVGWRIDYFFATQVLLPRIVATTIHEKVFGSDHCPISVDLKDM